MSALSSPRDLAAARRAVAEPGYGDERLVLMAPTDLPAINAMSEIASDLLRKLGVNLDDQPSTGIRRCSHPIKSAGGEGRLERSLLMYVRHRRVEPGRARIHARHGQEWPMGLARQP